LSAAVVATLLVGCGAAADTSATPTGFREASRQDLMSARTWSWTRARERAGTLRPPAAEPRSAARSDDVSTGHCRDAIRRQIEGDIRVDRSKPAPCRHIDRPTYARLFTETFAEYGDRDLGAFGVARH
jgi:hypothetical protein